MTQAGSARERGARRRLGRFSVTIAVLAFGGPMTVSPGMAQQGWTPTVATAPGGTLHGDVPGAMNREPTNIDPRFFPSPRDTAPPPPVRSPQPQAGWSPVETGALPATDAPARAGTPAPATAPRAAVPLPDLSPVRPTQRPAMTAAAPKAQDDAGASPESNERAGEPIFKRPGPLDALPPDASEAQQYCFNTADTAADARFAWQAKKIREMEAELDKKARKLEAKTEEYKQWLAKRDDFARKAHEKLVGFYARMRPDAAAEQIATIDERIAAALVMKLETKVASQIMAEMDPERAAKIATIISGASKLPPAKRKTAAQAGAEAADGAPQAGDGGSPSGESMPAEGSGT